MRHLTLFCILLLFMVHTVVGVVVEDELPVYTGCGADIRGVPEGIIDYPEPGRWYKPNQNCIWDIILYEGERMILSFERFHLNRETDSLIIKNGAFGSSIGTFTRNSPIISTYFESEANAIFLHFQSDHRWNGKGFRVTWKRIVNEFPDSEGNQCMVNGTSNSDLLQQLLTSETTALNTIEKLFLKIQDMELEFQEMENKLQEMKNKQDTTQSQLQEMKNKQDLTQNLLHESKNKQATSQSRLQELKNKQEVTQNLLHNMKYEQETTQNKLDFIIEQLTGGGCWSVSSQVAHPEGFTETHDCILYTCTNGKWLKEGPDPECDNGMGCDPPNFPIPIATEFGCPCSYFGAIQINAWIGGQCCKPSECPNSNFTKLHVYSRYHDSDKIDEYNATDILKFARQVWTNPSDIELSMVFSCQVITYDHVDDKCQMEQPGVQAWNCTVEAGVVTSCFDAGTCYVDHLADDGTIIVDSLHCS